MQNRNKILLNELKNIWQHYVKPGLLKGWSWTKINSDIVSAVCITLIGFFWLFGLTVLDTTNMGLVTKGGDFSVSYMGSVLYRMDEWRWPIFTHMNLAYPYGISVHGTDGGPLLSGIFKLLTTLFGVSPQAQFVGIWMLISYVLQAYVSVLIFRHAFKNKFLIVLGSLFFVSAPIMMMRVFVHINLMPHFILLFPILMWMNNRLEKQDWIYMAILLSLGILTCPYFLPMQAGFFALLLYRKVWVEKAVSWKVFLKGLCLLTGVFFFWFYLLGMMTTEQEIASGGWRSLGLNLTALFNPIWSKSQVFNTLTPKADFDADNYFGLGLLLLLVIFFPRVKDLFKRENLKKNWPISLLLLGFTIFALSSNIKAASVVVLDYKPGKYIDWLGSVFRYSGRFFWPVWYLLAFFLIKNVGIVFKKYAVLALAVVLGIQLWDLYPTYMMKHSFVINTVPYVDRMRSPEWDRLADQYDNAFIFAHNENYAGIWRWAIKNYKNVNYGFLNRPSKKTHELINDVREQILSGIVPKKYDDYFFVIDKVLMKQINAAAQKNPDVAKLKTFIKHIDNYDILEYHPELEKNLNYEVKRIPVEHRYWKTRLYQISPYRVYRLVENGRKDYATIVQYDKQKLIIDWDKYSREEFKMQKDGYYHQVGGGK